MIRRKNGGARPGDLRRSVGTVLDRIIRRVVDVARPDRIVLYGSRARGEARRDSDYDLLVVYSGKVPCRKVSGSIHRSLVGINASVDVHVVPPAIFRRYRNTPCLIYYDIARQGKVLYDA